MEDEMEISEERKHDLRRMRGGTHYITCFGPDQHKETPEYRHCVEHGLHFDSVIHFVEQGGGMLTNDLTAKQTVQMTDATRERGGPSADYLFDRWFGPWTKGKSPDTIDNMRNGWRNHFRGSEMNTKPAALIDDIEYHNAILSLEGEDGKPMKRAGMRKWIGTWRRVVIKPLIRNGSRTYDPFEDIVLPKDKTDKADGDDKGYSMADFQKLRARANGQFTIATAEVQQAYLDISMGIGGRPNEVLMLKQDDFDLEKGEVLVSRARHGDVKDGQPKRTPLLSMGRRGYEMIANGPGFHEDGWLFFNHHTGLPFNKNYDFGTKQLCEALGIEYFGRYGFRHGYCYALEEGDFGEQYSREEIAKMLRHQGMDSINHYFRVNTDKLQKKAQRSTVPEALQPALV
jgi:integrase